MAIKATEGTGWTSSDYAPAIGRARMAGAFALAYHFLHAGSAAAQAAHAHAVAGRTPLMLDAEPTGSSRPGLGDITGFIDAYRRLGGTCNLVVLPPLVLVAGRLPGLGPLARRKCALWSSAYTGYTDDPHGTGWMPYGGLTPAIWQYTDARSFNGQRIDFNAYRGTLVQLKALAGGGAPAPPPPVRPGGKAPPFPYDRRPLPRPALQLAALPLRLVRRRRQRQRPHLAGSDGPPRVEGRHPGRLLRPPVRQACRAFQAEKNLPADGLVGARHLGSDMDRAGHPMTTPEVTHGPYPARVAAILAGAPPRVGLPLRAVPRASPPG